MHLVIVWTAGGAGVFGATVAALLTHQIGRCRLRPQLAAMREHLASCTNRKTAGPDSQTARPASPQLSAVKTDCVRELAGHVMEGVVNLDRHRRMLADSDPAANALLSNIEQEALRTMAARLADEAEGL